MSAQRRDTAQSVERGEDFAADVSRGPEWVGLFDGNGREMRVKAAEVEHWLRQGFRLSAVDLERRKDELGPLFAAAERAMGLAVDAVRDAGHVDARPAGPYAAAVAAVGALTAAIGDVFRDIHAAYPARQDAPVTLVERRRIPRTVAGQHGAPDRVEEVEETVEHQVDPAQVDEFLARDGWSRQGRGR